MHDSLRVEIISLSLATFVTLKKKLALQTALLCISDCHPSALLGALPKPCSASDAQPAVHCSKTLDSISGLSELCVCKVSIAPQSAFHNTRRCSSAHHQSPPRPQCGFWMELNTQGLVATYKVARWEVLQKQVSGLCVSTDVVFRNIHTVGKILNGMEVWRTVGADLWLGKGQDKNNRKNSSRIVALEAYGGNWEGTL